MSLANRRAEHIQLLKDSYTVVANQWYHQHEQFKAADRQRAVIQNDIGTLDINTDSNKLRYLEIACLDIRITDMTKILNKLHAKKMACKRQLKIVQEVDN